MADIRLAQWYAAAIFFVGLGLNVYWAIVSDAKDIPWSWFIVASFMAVAGAEIIKLISPKGGR